jgi:acetylornithine aminotransferase/acetylornithine/N-succinyldiaminopimelate aminotransferase
LVIVDEIQAGMGRTGKWCAYQHFGIQPDITMLAKPLAGGIPMGATLCTNEVARAFHAGMHGTTFGGGPLACAVAVAVIDAIEENHLLEHVVEVGEYFQEQLRSLALRHDAIIDVRGKGLMIAAELNSADLAKYAVTAMLKRHVIINCTSDTVLRFLPPYIFERAHVDTTIAALDAVFTEYASTGADQAVAVAAGGTNHG